LSDNELRQALVDYVNSLSIHTIDRKNLLYDFFKELFQQERIVRASDIIKSNLIPIESPDMNRALQISILSALDMLSNKLGMEKIPVEKLLDVSWKACGEIYPYFTKTRKIDPKEIKEYLSDFGIRIPGNSIILEKPVFLLFISSNRTKFLRKATELREQTKSLLTQDPQPVFFQKRVEKLEKLVCKLQKYLITSGGTEFVYTRGRKERLIYDKIENMVLQCEQCFRIMMAYMSEETKILYGLVEKLKQLEGFRVRMLLRFEEPVERNQPNMAAVKDLKEAIIRKGQSEKQRDSMLRRLQIKFFRADPSKFHRLHAKMFISDENSIMAASANLIPTSLESNVEAGFYSEDPYLVKDGINFFEKVWEQCY